MEADLDVCLVVPLSRLAQLSLSLAQLIPNLPVFFLFITIWNFACHNKMIPLKRNGGGGPPSAPLCYI